MPEVNVLIGTRNFILACNEGEEPHLEAAAKLLSAEADTLQSQIGRVTEARMLLMSGLMLADKVKELEWEVRASVERVKELEAQLRAAEVRIGGARQVRPLRADCDLHRSPPLLWSVAWRC